MSWNNDVLEMAPDIGMSEPLEEVINQLLDGDFQTRWEAAKRLSAFGPEAIAHLISLVLDPDLEAEIRWFAARTLGEFQLPQTLQALVQILQQARDPELIAIAAEGISHFGESGVYALVQLLDETPYRLTAVHALANIRHQAALAPLLAAADDPNPAVRGVAIAALGNFRAAAVDRCLLKAIDDPALAVRREAITQLGLRPHLLTEVNLVEKLQPKLWDLAPVITEATAIALGRLGTAPAIASLATVLTSPHTPTALQICIVRALGWTEQLAALEALTAAQPTASTAVQLAMVAALAQWQAPPLRQAAGEALTRWLQTEVSAAEGRAEMKQAIALALGHLHHHAALPLLQTLAQDPHAPTQLHAAAALRRFA